MEKLKLENLTEEQIEMMLHDFEKELNELNLKLKKVTSIPISKIPGGFSQELADDTKRKVNIQRCIRVCRQKLLENRYINGTQDVSNKVRNIIFPQFSWGVLEKEMLEREKLIDCDLGKGDRITVSNCGQFKYITDRDDVRVEDMPDNKKAIDEVKTTIMQNGSRQIPAEEIRDLLKRHPEISREDLYILEIKKRINGEEKNYFVLSPVTKKQLEDPRVRQFFINSYCSSQYLESVVNGENGVYAGAIKENKDGLLNIRFYPDSVKAAMLAERIPGTTLLSISGLKRDIPGEEENLKTLLEKYRQNSKAMGNLDNGESKRTDSERI